MTTCGPGIHQSQPAKSVSHIIRIYLQSISFKFTELENFFGSVAAALNRTIY